MFGHLQYTPLVPPLLGAAAVVLALAAYTYRRRRSAGAWTFIALLCGLCQWSVCYALVLAGTDVETKMFWYQVQYLGVVLVPTSWLLFGLRYTRHPLATNRRFLALLAVEPLLTLALAFTNGLHHLMWPTVGIERSDAVYIAVTFGPGYWMNTLYSYAMAMAGTAALGWTLIRARRFFGRQALALTIASLAPVIGNGVYTAGFTGNLDLAPFSFAISGVAFFWGFFRYGFMDVIPIARGSVFDAIDDGVLVLDELDRIVDLNAAACRILGTRPADSLSKPLSAVLPQISSMLIAPDAEPARLEVALSSSDGPRVYEARYSTVSTTNQGAIGRLLLLHDVSEQKVAAAALRASEERFKAQYNHLPTPTYSWQYVDGDFVLMDYNVAAAKRSQGRVMSMPGARVSQYNPTVRADFQRCFTEHESFTREMVDPRGPTHRVLEVTYTFVAPDLVMVHSDDITERRHAEKALEYQALHDPLTDLPNRHLLHGTLESLHSEVNYAPFALLMMDLDRFKEVNDTLGHRCGDLLLQGVAARLRDVLADQHLVARLGGDEFAILLHGASEDDAVLMAERVIAALEAPFELEGSVIQAGASIGIAVSPRHGRDPDDLVRRADVAMYTAKRAKSGYAIYDARNDDHRPDRLSMVPELRRAIERGELFLEFQPKVQLLSGDVVGAEALLRWRHPQRGLVPPTEFIQIAEQTGLIGALSQWVLRAGVAQCAEWHVAGIRVPVAVNLSMHDLHDVSLPTRLAELLEEFGLPADMLELEITESMLMSEPERAAAVTAELGRLGVRVAVDDFGTGYSSLAYLKRLHIDTLKIDRSLVGDLAHQTTDRVIVKSMVSLAHELGMQVVAEGVEDRATYEVLRLLGCDQAQGYLLGRPVSADDFASVNQAALLAA